MVWLAVRVVPLPCWVKVRSALTGTEALNVPPVDVELAREMVTVKPVCDESALVLTSHRLLPEQPVTEIGELLLKEKARTTALTVAVLLTKVVSAVRSITVSVAPKTPLGLVAIGAPVSDTRPEKAAEPVQKKPAGRRRST